MSAASDETIPQAWVDYDEFVKVFKTEVPHGEQAALDMAWLGLTSICVSRIRKGKT